MPEEKISPNDAVKMVIEIDVEGVRAQLEKMLSKRKCADFVKELLKRVSEHAQPANRELVEGGDVLKIYDLIQKQRGMIRQGTPKADPFVSNGALGSIAQRNAGIQIGRFRPGQAVTLAELEKKYREVNDPPIALHETIHHAGRLLYSDQDLATAVSTMPGDRPALPVTSDRFAFSNYWDNELRKHCS